MIAAVLIGFCLLAAGGIVGYSNGYDDGWHDGTTGKPHDPWGDLAE